MSKPGQNFRPLLPNQAQQPKSNFGGPHSLLTFVRDQCSVTTWLCLGALAQGVLFLGLGRVGFLPAAAVIFYRVLSAYAMAVGWKRNPAMDNVILGKMAAQFPNEIGEYGSKPADSDVVVFLIGSRWNHPLGMLAPGWREFNSFFPKMVKDLEANADKYGFLGMTSWLNLGETDTKSEILSVGYFRTVDGLHRFAHDSVHREGWEWLNRYSKKYPHISFFHETYHVPKGNWESIAVNSHPTGIHSTISKVTDPVTGDVAWASPIVDASRGLLKTSAGRMSRSDAKEHEKYGADPYQ